MYCHRKFGPLSKPRLCYTPEFKAEITPPFLRHSAVKVHRQNCVGGPHNLSADQLSKWTVYHTSVPPKTPAFGVKVFDTYRISGKKLGLTLLIFGLNKRWHFRYSLDFARDLWYTIQTSLGGTAKHTARYVCHPPTFAGG